MEFVEYASVDAFLRSRGYKEVRTMPFLENLRKWLHVYEHANPKRPTISFSSNSGMVKEFHRGVIELTVHLHEDEYGDATE